MIVKIKSMLETIYTFLPEEVFIILIAGLLLITIEFFKGTKDRWTNQKEKKYK
jgi:hypothetical protein